MLERDVKVRDALYLDILFGVDEEIMGYFFNPGDETEIQKKSVRLNNHDKNTINHDFSTDKGDSGFPLIIQPEETGRLCYIVAIHFGKKVVP